MWVPSCTGITGNEDVNLLANQTILYLKSTQIKLLPYKDISSIINQISTQQSLTKTVRTNDITIIE